MALVLGGWTHDWLILAFVVLIAGLWLFAESTGGIWARIRGSHDAPVG